jgi:hypothetical protein
MGVIEMKGLNSLLLEYLLCGEFSESGVTDCREK